MSLKILIFSLALLIICSEANAQNVVDVAIHFYEDSTLTREVLPDIALKIDSADLERSINLQLFNLYEMGYLSATHKIRYPNKSRFDVHFFTNRIFKIISLAQGTVSDEILNKIGYDARQFNNKPFSHRRITGLLNSLLDYAENNGYPFATIKLDSIQIANKEIYGWLNYQSGPLIVFDSLIITGYDKVKSKYLMTHLGIYTGNSYEENLIQEIPNKLKLLPFLTINKKPEVQISNGRCNIYLELSQNKVSKLDGILGVLPNQNERDKILITGQLNLDLHNLFSSGKRIALEWQSFDANSQLLDFLYYHPNLFRTPLNIQGDFYLLKQDSTFINREFGLELSLLAKNSSKIGFISEFNSSRLISTDGLENVLELPENADYNVNYYGVNYLVNRYNNPNVPTNGWGININGSIGQKKIIENPVFSDEVFNGIDLKTIQLKIEGELDKYWKIYKNILLKSRLQGGYLEGDNLFQSDLFRIGGLRSLRGFVENQFFTPSYAIANLELRSMFSENTFFMLFFDQAVVKDYVEISNEVQYPFGTGAGFSFTTNAGVFNFVFAMGKSRNQPFGIEYSKIHFGYISRF